MPSGWCRHVWGQPKPSGQPSAVCTMRQWKPKNSRRLTKPREASNFCVCGISQPFLSSYPHAFLFFLLYCNVLSRRRNPKFVPQESLSCAKPYPTNRSAVDKNICLFCAMSQGSAFFSTVAILWQTAIPNTAFLSKFVSAASDLAAVVLDIFLEIQKGISFFKNDIPFCYLFFPFIRNQQQP